MYPALQKFPLTASLIFEINQSLRRKFWLFEGVAYDLVVDPGNVPPHPGLLVAVALHHPQCLQEALGARRAASPVIPMFEAFGYLMKAFIFLWMSIIATVPQIFMGGLTICVVATVLTYVLKDSN